MTQTASNSTAGQYDFLLVATATETREEAEQLAKLAVQGRFAAGAQILGPTVSAFWHLGEFGVGEEWRLSLPTHVSRFSELEQLLRENHSWTKPEISAVPIVAGSADYLDWIRRSVLPEAANGAT